jgi:hypothetical protein
MAPIASAGSFRHDSIERQQLERNRYYGSGYGSYNGGYVYNNRPNYSNSGHGYSNGYRQSYSSYSSGQSFSYRDGGRSYYNNRSRGYEGRGAERGYRR